MTLVVSEVSKFGIAMAADSAITTRYPSTFLLQSGKPAPPTVRTGAQKIVPIRAINAAISVWGFGTIGTTVDQDAKIPIDKFLSDFAESINPRDELDEVGEKLAKVVNARIRIGEVRGGFHLAGYTQEAGVRFPALFHIHTGHNPEGPHEELRLYRDFPFDSGRNVQKWLEDLKSWTFWLRNGSYDVYASFSENLNNLMSNLEKHSNFICPDHSKFSTPLEARGRYLKLQIQTICEFYRLSNKLETIAMPVSWITISSDRIEHFDPIII
jgi:hypothetical protein